MIKSRLSSLSTTKTEFEQVKGPYVDALKEAGYKDQTLNFSEIRNNNNRKNRKRNICWFNPPYSSQVSTNLTKFFNHLIRKHFKKDTLLGKLFNTNNIKLSYSTTSNLGQIISGHNKKVLSKTKPTQQTKTCNCRKGPATCPASGECQLDDVIYEATVKNTADNDDRKYIGLTATTFKVRYGNHKSDFKISERRTSSKLAGYIWKLKDKSIGYDVKFRIKERAPSYTPISERCLLCLTEKLRIMQCDQNIYLNHRSELLCKCRHRNKWLLSKFG